MLKQIDARAAHLENLDADVREWEKKHAKEAEADLRRRGAQSRTNSHYPRSDRKSAWPAFRMATANCSKRG